VAQLSRALIRTGWELVIFIFIPYVSILELCCGAFLLLFEQCCGLYVEAFRAINYCWMFMMLMI